MSKIIVDETYCKGCALCVHYCSKKVLGLSQRQNSKGYAIPHAVDPESCTRCRICERMCPEFALTVEKERSKEASK